MDRGIVLKYLPGFGRAILPPSLGVRVRLRGSVALPVVRSPFENGSLAALFLCDFASPLREAIPPLASLFR